MADLFSTPGAIVGKILMIGNNGAGKTGSLVPLAKAGYKIRLLDYDNGYEILMQLLSAEKAKDPSLQVDVDVESFTDPYHSQPGTGALRAKDATAFTKSMQTLANWPKYGSPATWGADTVLVVDSLTFMGRAAMNHVFKMKGKLASLDPKDMHPSQPDWGDAMGLQENFLAMLGSLKCHVIVMSHITFVTPDGETAQKGFPSALGSKLPPKVGSYFNATLFVTTEGAGANKRRVIQTKSVGLIDTKTPAPGKVKDSYPIETGLADYFKDLYGPLKAQA
jgi:hypothetical protein